MSRRVGYGAEHGGSFTATAKPNPWAPYLARGEKILWEGHPVPGVVLSSNRLMTSAFGLVFFAFAVFWMAKAGFPSLFSLFGILFVIVGINMAVGRWIREYLQSFRTTYAISNQNCFVATDFFGRRLKTYPLEQIRGVELWDNPVPSVIFAEEIERDSDGDKHSRQIGFFRIREGHEVFRRLREITKSNP